jgi:prepilin-type N-terminal cleavage/methylation domain-containing protein
MTRTHASCRGMSVIELLVALSVMSLVLVAVFSSFFRSQQAQQDVTDSVNLRQGARGAVQLMERELRMAGSGWGRIQVDAWLGAADTLYALVPGPGSEGGCDSVSILGAWEASTTLRDAMPNSSSILKVVSTTGFQQGDLCVVTDGRTAHLFQVTQVQSPPENLQHNPSSSYNPPGGHNGWPAGGYGVGAQVYKLCWVSYYVDSLNFRRPSVVRRVFGAAPQLLAYDVGTLQVRYRLQDSTLTRSPEGINMIDEILPVIITRSAPRGRPVLVDSVWTSVRPRTF